MTPRTLISSGSYLEPEIGFSRAVRVGNQIAVAGTAPIASGGGTAAPGDVYGQTLRCLEIIAKAITDAGGSIGDVTRTRMMLTDISTWHLDARAPLRMRVFLESQSEYGRETDWSIMVRWAREPPSVQPLLDAFTQRDLAP